MNLFEPRRVEISARDSRLIGDQDQRKSGVPQQSQPLNRARRKLDSVRIPQVDLVDDDRSVAIDERNPPRRPRGGHGAAGPLANATRGVGPGAEPLLAAAQMTRSGRWPGLTLHPTNDVDLNVAARGAIIRRSLGKGDR